MKIVDAFTEAINKLFHNKYGVRMAASATSAASCGISEESGGEQR